jgi:hypothetical protein
MSRDTENPMVRDELWPRDSNNTVPERVGKCELCHNTIWAGHIYYYGKTGFRCEKCGPYVRTGTDE